MTKIEWTTKTWNPVVGCSVVSPGCTNCYAMKEAWRFSHNPSVKHIYEGTVKKINGNPVWTGKVNFNEKALLKPLHWKKPRKVFVNSMSDLFHEDMPDEWIDQVFAVMALTPQHTYQILTKRPDRMQKYLTRGLDDRWLLIEDIVEQLGGSPREMDSCDWLANHHFLPNVWLGVSAEDQRRADERIPWLMDIPAAKKFVSCEPLLGAVDLTQINMIPLRYRKEDDPTCHLNVFTGNIAGPDDQYDRVLDWVIVGGESGPKARPMHPDWARGLRDQCLASSTPFFFKQWGEYIPVKDSELPQTFHDPDIDNFRCMCSNGFVGDLSIGSAFNHNPKRYPDCFPGGDDSEAICNSVNIKHVHKNKQPKPATLDGVSYQQFPAEAE